MTKTIWEVQPGKNRNTGSSITPAEPAADYEETSRQRGKIGRRKKASEEEKPMLEVETHPIPAVDENRAGHGKEENGNEGWQVNLLT